MLLASKPCCHVELVASNPVTVKIWFCDFLGCLIHCISIDLKDAIQPSTLIRVGYKYIATN